jgi:hypothetical protein
MAFLAVRFSSITARCVAALAPRLLTSPPGGILFALLTIVSASTADAGMTVGAQSVWRQPPCVGREPVLPRGPLPAPRVIHYHEMIDLRTGKPVLFEVFPPAPNSEAKQ